MIDLNPNDLKTIAGIIEKHLPNCLVFAFGSRVHGTARQFSDLDLIIKHQNNIDNYTNSLEALKEDLAESDLPIMIDILIWDNLSVEFRNAIQNDLVLFNDNHEKRS